MNTPLETPTTFKSLHAPALVFGALCAALSLGHAQALTPPKYLSIPHVRQCLSEKSAGSYNTVCLPAARPAQCPKSSWRALYRLDGDERPPGCRGNDRQSREFSSPMSATLGWVLNATSSVMWDALLPRSREWPGNVETTGFWFLDDGAAWTPPPALARFLDDGPAPVYVGFGSMAFLDRGATLDAVMGALEKTRARAVISAGWGGLKRDRLPESALGLDEAPHDWLFPRMAAIVHHGGAGTTGAALRAGKPSVVTPFIVDQFPWARLLHSRGLAPAPLPHRALTADSLAAAIETALNDAAMRRRAGDMGARVRAEDGVGRALETVLRAARA